MFIEHMVEVCRGLWRVLRDDGTMWLNLGDCYASSPNGWSADRTKAAGKDDRTFRDKPNSTVVSGLKAKDLVMMPHRVALALQAEGWYVRSTIVWSKPNPMPESCTDRPTSAHEYIFELTKSGKPTYWVHRDGAGARSKPRADYRYLDLLNGIEYIERPEEFNAKDQVSCPDCGGARKISGWFGEVECEGCKGKGRVKRWKRINLWRGHDYYYDADAVREKGEIPAGTLAAKGSEERRAVKGVNARPPEYKEYTGTRNLRNVWQIATQPYPEAHFATFPERIPELCIKAGTSEWGCCPQCGAPWERVVEVSEEYTEWAKTQRFYGEGGKGSAFRMAKTNSAVAPPKGTTKGFQPTCDCPVELEPIPCTVLDPFAGSGTTIAVARRLGRSAMGIDINPEYKKLAEERAMLDIRDIMSFEDPPSTEVDG